MAATAERLQEQSSSHRVLLSQHRQRAMMFVPDQHLSRLLNLHRLCAAEANAAEANAAVSEH